MVLASHGKTVDLLFLEAEGLVDLAAAEDGTYLHVPLGQQDVELGVRGVAELELELQPCFGTVLNAAVLVDTTILFDQCVQLQNAPLSPLHRLALVQTPHQQGLTEHQPVVRLPYQHITVSLNLLPQNVILRETLLQMSHHS